MQADAGGQGPQRTGVSSRKRGAVEPETEHAFWCRYWEALWGKGVPPGLEIWHERACARFIRELKPRRLKAATAEDVTQFLGLLAQQPDATAWKIRQADDALRILFQELVCCPWAEHWPVGLPELEGWVEGPEGGGKMPVPTDAAQARFTQQVNKMITVLRCLHYSYRTEEAYVGWARRFLSFSQAHGLEELDGEKVRAFLEELAVQGRVSASTQNQALNSLVFFFREG